MYINVHHCFYFLLMWDLFVRYCSWTAVLLFPCEQMIFLLSIFSKSIYIWRHVSVLNVSKRKKKKDLWHPFATFSWSKFQQVAIWYMLRFSVCSYLSGRVKQAGTNVFKSRGNISRSLLTDLVVWFAAILWFEHWVALKPRSQI